ncbi:MAG: WG repeat-containing protein [Candidatus Obscuribacterales bacterium]
MLVPAGEFCHSAIFSEAKSFSDGLAAVRSTKSGKVGGFSKPDGKLAIDYRFDDANSFHY